MLAKWSWIIGGFFLAKIANEIVYAALNSPGDEVNVVKAAIPALVSALVLGACIWKSEIFTSKKKL